MSLPAKYKLTLTTPTGMRSEQSGNLTPERYAVLCGVLGGKLPDDQALAERDRATELLAKYRQHVGDCEGSDFLDQLNVGWSDVTFTPAEVAALMALRKENNHG